ncbi:MAG: phosphomannomutase/phosphoglucomutase [Proteobacteria bacterium]|nr:phosphomannomutase/phosphoglucomutase [Pseudomonadota bacterium]
MANKNITSFGMIPGAAVIAGFVVASLLSVFVLQSGVNASHQSGLCQALAAEIAQQVNIKEAQLVEQLGKIASSSLATNSISGTIAELSEAEQTIAQILPFAERVRLIPAGQAKTDQGFPPFNFIALDMVKSIEAGKSVSPEAISSQPQLEGEKWIMVAAPVKRGDGNIQGTLLTYFNAQSISTNLNDATRGQVWVVQTVGAADKAIATSGSAGTGPTVTSALNNPNWSLQYSPSTAISDNSPAGFLIYLLPGIALLLIALGGTAFGAMQTGTLIQRNLTVIGGQIGRVASGNYDNDVSYTLPGFADQDSKLKQLLNYAPAKADDSKPALAKKQSNKKLPPKDTVVDIEMTDDDLFEEVEEFEVDDFDAAVEEANKSSVDFSSIEHIFRAYDIRGIVGESISEDIARQIGRAIGSEAGERGEQSLLVGYDGREYSPALAEALMEGITASGRDVVNIGSVPTPVLYYATSTSDTKSGVMVTGSHNAPDYNGFKVVLEGKALIDHEISAPFQRIQEDNFSSGSGSISAADFTQDYIDAISDDVVVAQPLKVVIDCGNGIAGSIAPELLDNLGCETVPLYCEVDGNFPNHHPDPTKPENLKDLITTVKSQGADLGIALDGDGDRLVAVTAAGEIVWPDRLLMLFAKDIVSRNPGSDVVYDVKCTRHLNSVISGFGGRPIICRSGHSFIKQKIADTDALLGGELSGHICFSERWYGFDDGLYSAARLLEIVGSQEDSLADLLAEFPASVATPEIHIAVSDSEKFALIETLVGAADFEDATLTTIDGLRVDFADGWGLIRASNTEPALTLRFEADSEESLEDIKGAFRELLQEVKSDLDFE